MYICVLHDVAQMDRLSPGYTGAGLYSYKVVYSLTKFTTFLLLCHQWCIICQRDVCTHWNMVLIGSDSNKHHRYPYFWFLSIAWFFSRDEH